MLMTADELRQLISLALIESQRQKMIDERKRKEPRKGTGKKPKGSSRRLYTDENPKDTVSVKFRTATDIRKTHS